MGLFLLWLAIFLVVSFHVPAFALKRDLFGRRRSQCFQIHHQRRFRIFLSLEVLTDKYFLGLLSCGELLKHALFAAHHIFERNAGTCNHLLHFASLLVLVLTVGFILAANAASTLLWILILFHEPEIWGISRFERYFFGFARYEIFYVKWLRSCLRASLIYFGVVRRVTKLYSLRLVLDPEKLSDFMRRC